MSDESDAILCLAQQIYCQGPNNAQNNSLALAYTGLALFELAYWGTKYGEYNSDLDDKLKKYRADLKCKVDQFCANTFGTEDFPEGAGILEKGVAIGCDDPPEDTHFSAFNDKANNIAKLYDFTSECPTDFRACAAGPAILASQEFDINLREETEVANIEFMAQLTRGQERLASEITSLRGVAIDTCNSLIADATSGINNAFTGLGTSFSYYETT